MPQCQKVRKCSKNKMMSMPKARKSQLKVFNDQSWNNQSNKINNILLGYSLIYKVNINESMLILNKLLNT